MGVKRREVSTEKSIPERIDPDMFYGMKLDKEQEVFANAILNKDIDIVYCDARAGTGKTTVATGVANLLVCHGAYSNIVYIMSPYGERKQGWLPGTITEKSSVYFEAFYQALIKCNVNLNTCMNIDIANQKYGTGYISCITDTYLRGSNLDDSVIIIDEAQNYTVQQLKKVLTRVGSHAKVIVIGHQLQCDLDDKSSSGFKAYLDHFADMDRCAICTLTHNHRGWISQHADELEE